jgi:hypothetical protein
MAGEAYQGGAVTSCTNAGKRMGAPFVLGLSAASIRLCAWFTMQMRGRPDVDVGRPAPCKVPCGLRVWHGPHVPTAQAGSCQLSPVNDQPCFHLLITSDLSLSNNVTLTGALAPIGRDAVVMACYAQAFKLWPM